MTALHPNAFEISTPVHPSQDDIRSISMKNLSSNNFDQPTAYRMWFRDLLWRAFPAQSDAARAERAAKVLDVSERQVRNWLRCENDPKLRYVMAVLSIAGAEIVFSGADKT